MNTISVHLAFTSAEIISSVYSTCNMGIGPGNETTVSLYHNMQYGNRAWEWDYCFIVSQLDHNNIIIISGLYYYTRRHCGHVHAHVRVGKVNKLCTNTNRNRTRKETMIIWSFWSGEKLCERGVHDKSKHLQKQTDCYIKLCTRNKIWSKKKHGVCVYTLASSPGPFPAFSCYMYMYVCNTG